MRYHNITKDDMLNGDGLRVVLWVSGCGHACRECQNQLTWDPQNGLEFDASAKQEIFDELNKSYISGVTLSGGDPLYPGNVDEIALLVNEVKERFPQKTIWLYTGSLWEEIKDYELIGNVDVVVDGEYECDKRETTLRWRGSSNQRVIDVKASKELGKIVLHCE